MWGGKHHELPVHHKAEGYLDAYIKAAGMADQKGTPLWRAMTKERGWGDGLLLRDAGRSPLLYLVAFNPKARQNSHARAFHVQHSKDPPPDRDETPSYRHPVPPRAIPAR